MSNSVMNFRELYQNYTNAELLKIVHDEHEYQSEAVQVARLILEERNVSETEIAEELKRTERKEKESEQNTDEIIVKSTIKEKFLQLFNPFIPSETDEEKNKNIIIILCILVGFDFLESLPRNLRTFFVLFTEHTPEVLSQMHFIVIAFLPFISVILLYKRYKIGWCLFVLDFVFTVATAIAIYIRTEKTSMDIPIEFDYWRVVGNVYDVILDVCYCTGIITILCAKGIRNLYKIDSVLMKNCLILSLFVSILYYFLL